MKILVDADGCPSVIKEILFRVADRVGVELVLVANHIIPIPKRNNIKFMLVSSGFDVADNKIVQLVEEGDLVITSDIPLAADVIDKSAKALSFHGEMFTTDNIKSKLSMRNFMEILRNSGVETSGKSAFSHKDRQSFANQLDKILAVNF